MILRPADFGAVGDGWHDDAPALAALFDAAMSAEGKVTVDLSGHWFVASTVAIRLPQRGRMFGGHIEAHEHQPGTSPPAPVYLADVATLDLGARCRVTDLRITGQMGTGRAWITNRNADNAIRILAAPSCVLDGFEVEAVRRWGILQDPSAGMIDTQIRWAGATYCGTCGFGGAPAYTRAAGEATEIVRMGAVSTQTAAVSLDFAAPLGVGDYLRIEGHGEDWLCEVLSVDGSDVVVWPWPGTLQGSPEDGEHWYVEALCGGAIRTQAGNTANLQVDGLDAKYCAVGLSILGLSGVIATGVHLEPGGAAVVAGSLGTKIRRASVRGLHSEQSLYDVVVGGKAPPVLSVTDASRPVTTEERSWHVRPVDNTGATIPAPWPLVGLLP